MNIKSVKLPAGIVQLYRSVHSWVGICSGLCLFVAFYAGAITMFEKPLQNYLSFPKPPQSGVALKQIADLQIKTFAAFPEAQKDYAIIISEGHEKSAYIRWPGNGIHSHNAPNISFSTLNGKGELVTQKASLSQTAHFIDVLHRQVGLPLPRKLAMIFMGIVALLYSMALFSAVIIYLPHLKKTIFAVRIKNGFRKKWLDFHNLLGFFSLPFHIIMALSSVVFAFHGEIYAIEQALLAPSSPKTPIHKIAFLDKAPLSRKPLDSVMLLHILEKEAPGFRPQSLNYSHRHNQLLLNIAGYDPRYSHRGPDGTFIPVNPYDGKILSTDYLPGHQRTGYAVLTSLFSLHFGSYGGILVRLGYVILGFGGAFLFYTGNHLWIDSRRKKHRLSGHPHDHWDIRFLEKLTSSWVFGTITGISALLCVSLFTAYSENYVALPLIYYGILIVYGLIGWLCPYSLGNYIQKRGAILTTLCICAALLFRYIYY